MTMTSIKHSEVNLVTKIFILTIEVDESPFPFASKHANRIELHSISKQNERTTKRHRLEIIPRGDGWRLSDKEWQAISVAIPRRKGIKYDMREIVDLILVKMGTGCPWRLLPFGNLNFPIVQNTYHRLTKSGNWEEVKKTLNMMRAKHACSVSDSESPQS